METSSEKEGRKDESMLENERLDRIKRQKQLEKAPKRRETKQPMINTKE
jgi:hypothetical protein